MNQNSGDYPGYLSSPDDSSVMIKGIFPSVFLPINKAGMLSSLALKMSGKIFANQCIKSVLVLWIKFCLVSKSQRSKTRRFTLLEKLTCPEGGDTKEQSVLKGTVKVDSLKEVKLEQRVEGGVDQYVSERHKRGEEFRWG